MGWASGMQAGTAMARSAIDAYEDSRKRREEEEAGQEFTRARGLGAATPEEYRKYAAQFADNPEAAAAYTQAAEANYAVPTGIQRSAAGYNAMADYFAGKGYAERAAGLQDKATGMLNAESDRAFQTEQRGRERLRWGDEDKVRTARDEFAKRIQDPAKYLMEKFNRDQYGGEEHAGYKLDYRETPDGFLAWRINPDGQADYAKAQHFTKDQVFQAAFEDFMAASGDPVGLQKTKQEGRKIAVDERRNDILDRHYSWERQRPISTHGGDGRAITVSADGTKLLGTFGSPRELAGHGAGADPRKTGFNPVGITPDNQTVYQKAGEIGLFVDDGKGGAARWTGDVSKLKGVGGNKQVDAYRADVVALGPKPLEKRGFFGGVSNEKEITNWQRQRNFIDQVHGMTGSADNGAIPITVDKPPSERSVDSSNQNSPESTPPSQTPPAYQPRTNIFGQTQGDVARAFGPRAPAQQQPQFVTPLPGQQPPRWR